MSTRSPCCATRADAAALLDAGDDRGAADLCASTLTMFRGDVLAGAGDGEWVIPHRARLDAARMQLLETGCSARLRLGEAGEVIGELEAAVAAYPYQESLWVLLITALYQAGRQADALAAYQRVRDTAGRRARPRPRAAAAAARAADPDPRRGARRRADTIVASTRRSRSGNLPSMSAELVGRDSELAALSRPARRRNRLVEIVGPGGIGKTALAIATGRAHARRAAGPAACGWPDSRRRDGRRRHRHLDRRGERHRRRGRPVRAVQGHRRADHPRQLRARRRRRRRPRRPPPRRGARAADPVHQPGPARHRRRDAVRARTARPRRRRRAVHPPRHRAAQEPSTRRRPTTRCTSCAVRSTVCRWRSNSPRHEPRRCRSRRSPAASTTASTC